MGSRCTPSNYIWHLALAMRAPTESSALRRIMDMLLKTATNDVGYESFDGEPTTILGHRLLWQTRYVPILCQLDSTIYNEFIPAKQCSKGSNGNECTLS
jgi:hypothetical protein